MKFKNKKRYFLTYILGAILLALFLLASKYAINQGFNQIYYNGNINLTVKVRLLYPDDQVVTGASVVVLNPENKKIIRKTYLNKDGEAYFRLKTGDYIVKMFSGYTGSEKVNLEEDSIIEIKVLPVSQ